MHLEHVPGTTEKKNIKCHSLCLPFFAVPVMLFPQNQPLVGDRVALSTPF